MDDVTFPNLNGIETTPGGNSLIVAHTSAQKLYTVDPATGDAEAIDLGGVFFVGADGLIRRGTTVYVVDGLNQVTAVKICRTVRAGRSPMCTQLSASRHPLLRVCSATLCMPLMPGSLPGSLQGVPS